MKLKDLVYTESNTPHHQTQSVLRYGLVCMCTEE